VRGNLLYSQRFSQHCFARPCIVITRSMGRLWSSTRFAIRFDGSLPIGAIEWSEQISFSGRESWKGVQFWGGKFRVFKLLKGDC
jgi:hypothetical protein